MYSPSKSLAEQHLKTLCLLSIHRIVLCVGPTFYVIVFFAHESPLLGFGHRELLRPSPVTERFWRAWLQTTLRGRVSALMEYGPTPSTTFTRDRPLHLHLDRTNVIRQKTPGYQHKRPWSVSDVATSQAAKSELI